jgi:hypothetical protein
MKDSRTGHVPEGGAVDRMAGDLAHRLADRFSRRNALVSLASGVAAYFGVKFLAPAFGQTLNGVPLAALAARQATGAPCSHTGSCFNDGFRCGMAASIDCTEFKRRSNNMPGYIQKTCGNCWASADDVCPSGAVQGNYWEACCKCTEDPTRGSWIEYYDCCMRKKADGNWDIHPDCVSDACMARVNKNGVTGSGCQKNGGGLRDCPLVLRDPATGKAIPNYDEWCGYNTYVKGKSQYDIGGMALCTYAHDTGRPCGSS